MTRSRRFGSGWCLRQAAGLKLKGTCRNIYLEGPPHHKDKAKFVTQVALPLVPDEL